MTVEHLGYLVEWLDILDPDDAVTQIDKNYRHGGGWHDYKGFKMMNGVLFSALPPPEFEPPDPPLRPLAKAQVREETVYFYDHSWVAVVQPDNSFRVARID